MIEVYCIRGLGDKELNPVEDDLIITDLMATKRGKNEIDRQWYLQHIQNLEVPFKKTDGGEAIMDDDIVEMSDPFFGLSGVRKVNKVVISGTSSKLTMNLELVKFEEFI